MGKIEKLIFLGLVFLLMYNFFYQGNLIFDEITFCLYCILVFIKFVIVKKSERNPSLKLFLPSIMYIPIHIIYIVFNENSGIIGTHNEEVYHLFFIGLVIFMIILPIVQTINFRNNISCKIK